MTREERIRRLMVGLYRARGGWPGFGPPSQASDAEVIGWYGDAARPEAEAILDVLEDLIREREV